MTKCADCPRAEARRRLHWVAPRREVPLSGVLNIDKPPGITSHDVVDMVRRMSGQRKVGHAGTLDPMATGVLLVCLGQATRVAEYLMAGRKSYRANIVLGTTTSTYDADGEILSSGGQTDFAREEIQRAFAAFVGRLEQVPPMYSALKRGGQPLYKLAREGKTVELAPRPVEIAEIILLDWTSPSLVIEIACSPGTYVRSLAHDLGQRLGCGAYLTALVRLGSGRLTLEGAVSLERLEEAFQHGEEGRYLLPLDEALIDWPAMVVSMDDARRVAQGQTVRDAPPVPDGEPRSDVGDGAYLCRAYSVEGDFLAIMAYHAETGQWRPKKVFVSL